MSSMFSKMSKEKFKNGKNELIYYEVMGIKDAVYKAHYELIKAKAALG